MVLLTPHVSFQLRSSTAAPSTRYTCAFLPSLQYLFFASLHYAPPPSVSYAFSFTFQFLFQVICPHVSFSWVGTGPASSSVACLLAGYSTASLTTDAPTSFLYPHSPVQSAKINALYYLVHMPQQKNCSPFLTSDPCVLLNASPLAYSPYSLDVKSRACQSPLLTTPESDMRQARRRSNRDAIAIRRHRTGQQSACFSLVISIALASRFDAASLPH